ncbi:MAG: hypothetical protein JST33_08155 [Actinobacteria bacterium]|nr:hypothetical protein [Actinomycetota bacterium]
MDEQSAAAAAHAAAVPGGHALPGRFGSRGPDLGAAPRAKRRLRPGVLLAWVLPTAAIMIGAVAFTVLQVDASRGYDSALSGARSAEEQAAHAQSELKSGADELATAADVASAILAADTAGVLPADSRSALQAADDQAQTRIKDAHAAASSPSTAHSPKPFWMWDLGPATAHLQTQRTDAATQRKRADDALRDARAAGAALLAAGTAALDGAATNAPAVEQANVSARTGDVIALRQAAQDMAAGARHLDAGAQGAFTAYVAAVGAVQASNASKLAEKAGPLYDRRLEVEAWARSIAGGVLLDFDWGPIVNGFGDNGSAGGLTSWYGGHGVDPGHATITLSDSVAELWPDDRMQALVTHEVGHAISAKCSSMFDWRSRDANEAWATAWAISRGQTADGNGVSLYGTPPQSLIDTAATCR